MGPNDPFGGEDPAGAEAPDLSPTPRGAPGAGLAARFTLWGGLLGATLGGVGLVAGGRAALVLAVCIALGAAAGRALASIWRLGPQLLRVVRAAATAVGDEATGGRLGPPA